jgi:hypothetical protein
MYCDLMKTNLLSYHQSNNRSAASGSTGIGQTVRPRLKQIHWLGLVLAIIYIAGSQRAFASDPTGVFARIDKVVLEPNDTAPERIQVWGAFSMAQGRSGEQYESPKTGYLYYKLPAEKADVARKEWADLKSVAGKHEIIGFGTRFEEKGRIRQAVDKVANPDAYPLGWGLVKMKDRHTDYAPIKQLLALTPPTAPIKKE